MVIRLWRAATRPRAGTAVAGGVLACLSFGVGGGWMRPTFAVAAGVVLVWYVVRWCRWRWVFR